MNRIKPVNRINSPLGTYMGQLSMSVFQNGSYTYSRCKLISRLVSKKGRFDAHVKTDGSRPMI